MGMQSINFSKLEAEIILHRMVFFRDDSEALADVFDEYDDFDPARGAEFAQRVVPLLEVGTYSIDLDAPESIEILAECLEGSTFFGDMKYAVESKAITREQAAMYKRAAVSAARKIEAILERDVTLSFI